MRPGDRVFAIDGRQSERFEQVSQAIFYRPDENADFTIKRGSETVHLSIKIGTRKEPDRFGNEYRVGLIGIQSPPLEFRDDSLLEAPGVAVERTGPVIRQIGRAQVGTPVTNSHIVCRLVLDKKKTTKLTDTSHSLDLF